MNLEDLMELCPLQWLKGMGNDGGKEEMRGNGRKRVKRITSICWGEWMESTLMDGRGMVEGRTDIRIYFCFPSQENDGTP
jgi:hypothetical protein